MSDPRGVTITILHKLAGPALLLCTVCLPAQTTQGVPARPPAAAAVKPTPISAAFESLVQARSIFRDAHARETPTIDPASHTADGTYLGEWPHALDALDAPGKLPVYTPDQANAADAALNTAYREALARAAHCTAWPACTNAAEVQQSERAWLDYREAFVAYARLRWPAVAPEAWRTDMAIDRTSELTAIAP